MQLARLWAAVAACAGLGLASSTERNPIRRLVTLTNPSIQSPSQRVHAWSEFALGFDLPQSQRIELHLEPNHEVLHEQAWVTYLNVDGSVRNAEPIDRASHRVYKGTARRQLTSGHWETVGWARINVQQDGPQPVFDGVFTVHHDSHHIQPSSRYMSSKHAQDPVIQLGDRDYMVVWRDSDVATPHEPTQQELLRRAMEGGSTCSSDELEFNSNADHPVYADLKRRASGGMGFSLGGMLNRRQNIDSQPTSGNSAGVNLVQSIGNAAGCPRTRKVALVGVATDCTYTQTFASANQTRQHVISVLNSASQVWESSFNISLGLRNITVTPADCPGSVQQATPWNQDCNANLDISARLNLFSAWRGNQQDTNSHWTLLTNCRTGSAIGLAWLGQACVHAATTSNTTQGGAETVSGANVVARNAQEWQTIAHETGHTYGAVHDCTTDTCGQANVVNSQQCCPLSSSTCPAGGGFIMNPSTSPQATTFSACTIGNICSALGRNSVSSACLSDNRGVVTITGQQCGNGIVEAGEDCDCGGVDGCRNNPCCDASTCKFRNNAVCDDSNEDCCRNCQFASASTVCRASTGACDPEERCTGNQPNCPADAKTPDGTGCSLPAGANTNGIDTSALRCASGQCTSRDLQCKTVMGVYLSGSNDTYACDQKTCLLSCQSPRLPYNTCYSLNQNLLDGTPCGGDGHCNNGRCDGATFGGEAAGWFNDHRSLVIGIAAAVGGLILLAVLSCLWRCCTGRRRTPKRVNTLPPSSSSAAAPMVGAAGYYQQPRWDGPPPPSHTQPQMADWEQPGWRPPVGVPAPPPAAYGSGRAPPPGGWSNRYM